MGDVGLNTTWELLQAPSCTEEQLHELQLAWENASAINEFEAAAEVERAVYLDEWNRGIHRPLGQVLKWSEFSLSSWQDVRDWAGAMAWYVTWRQHDEARGVWLWQRAIEDVRSAISLRMWTVARKRFEQSEQDGYGRLGPYNRWQYQVSIPDIVTGSSLTPESLKYDVRRLLEYETHREMTVAAVALARYQLRHESMPSNLAALVPEFCAKIPHDYMDGADLRYRLNADGTWILYSVGDDGVDNGGDPRPSEPHRNVYSIWDGRDAVWPQPAL
jgi:hypothetical protein